MVTHIVKSGETLSRIANRYNVTLRNIQKANPSITDVNKINIGQKISIPIETATNYYDLGKQVEKCLNDIEKLDSFKMLKAMLKG